MYHFSVSLDSTKIIGKLTRRPPKVERLGDGGQLSSLTLCQDHEAKYTAKQREACTGEDH